LTIEGEGNIFTNKLFSIFQESMKVENNLSSLFLSWNDHWRVSSTCNHAVMKILTSNEVIGAHPFLHLDYFDILKLDLFS
jgi:hypothetical protein